eukprot:gene14946-15083_t
MCVHHRIEDAPDGHLFAGLSMPTPVASINRLVIRRPYRAQGLAARFDEIRIKTAQSNGVKTMIATPLRGQKRIQYLQSVGFEAANNSGIAEWSSNVTIVAMILRFYALDRSNELESELARLPRQAIHSFPIESPSLLKHDLGDARRLLDLGSGEGTYLYCLSQAFPALTAFGIDANPALLERRRQAYPTLNVRLGDITNEDSLARLIVEVTPDIITARYVLQHLEHAARDGLIAAVKRLKGDARFVCIEADDELFQIFPPCPAFDELNRINIERQAGLGGDRLIGKRLAETLEAHGYTDVRVTPVVVASQEIGLATWWDTYGPAFRRGFADFEAAAQSPVFQAAERWVSTHLDNRSAWISKAVVIVSGV